MDSDRLAASYRHCEQVARQQARNFYYSFLTLPRDRRASMCAVYAFMRYCDDVVDEPAGRDGADARIRAWRLYLDRALHGEYADDPILPAFHDTVIRYDIPTRYFGELIDGAEMDLRVSRYATFDELRTYCYRVAAVVGFVCLYIWGFDPSGGTALACGEACGVAFQLTNILRDIREDAGRNRIYIPQEDLARFDVSEADIKRGAMSDAFRDMMRFEVSRAEAFYSEATPLVELVHPRGRQTLRIMTRIYHGILETIVRDGYDVFSRRAAVSAPRKIGIVAGAWLTELSDRLRDTGARAGDD